MPQQKNKHQIASKHHKLGVEHEKKAQFKEAILHYEQAIPIYWELELIEEYVELNRILFQCLHEIGKSQIAMNRVEVVLSQLISMYGDSHLFVGYIYGSLGRTHWELANYPLALDFQQKSLKILLNELGVFHTEVAFTYSSLGAVYGYMGNYKEQIVVSLKALKIQLFHKDEKEIGSTYFNLGYAYRMIGQIYKAIDYYQQALQIYLKLYGNKHPHISMCYRALGGSYGTLGDLDKQIDYLKQSERIALAVYGPDYPELAHLYGYLATFYMVTGDLTKALLYYQRGLHINQKAFGESHDLTADFIAQIGYLFFRQEKYQEAQTYLEKALAIYLIVYDGPHPTMHYGYCQLGFVYAQLNQTQKALSCFQQALQICLNAVGAIHKDSIGCYLNFGKYYNGQKQFDKALFAYQKALDSQIQLLGIRHPITAKIYTSLADNCQSQKEYDLAIDYYGKGLRCIQINSDASDFQSIDLNNYKKIDSSYLLPLLKGKATAVFQRYGESKNLTDLQWTFHLYESAMLLLTKISKGYQSDFSKLFLSKENTAIYSKSVEVAYAMWQQNQEESYLKKLFGFVEKAKANVLLSAVKEDFAKMSAKIPPELLQREKQFKIKLTFLDKNIQREETKPNEEEKDEKQLLEWKNQYFDYHQQYLQLIQQFEQDYPDYYQLKYETQTASIEELQESLTENQVMLNYFVGEKHYYLFFITSNDFEVYDFEKPDDFEQTIEEFLQAIQHHQLEAYTRTAYQLYLWLVKSVEIFIMDQFSDTSAFSNKNLALDDTATELIVIPHGILNYVPFEALLCSPYTTSNTAENPYHSLDYLLLNCNVSYHYSATLWHYLLQSRGERATSNDSFVGFAPVYQSEGRSQKSEVGGGNEGEKSGVEENWTVAANGMRTWATRSEALRSDGSWTPLPHSKTEAQQIAALFDQKGYDNQTFLHDQATKTAFMEAAEKSRFVLIAAHGVVNDEQPKLSGLVFYPSSQPLSRSSTVDKVETPREETLATASRLANSWNGESSTDCILSMEEAYQLQLQADLVVLSSCESGIGQLAKGEGMMAVNRGFLYAGAKGVVSTLFKVYDKPSSRLTQYLFEGILEGAEATLALRAAKLRLLKEEKVDVKSWSGFVLIGG